MIKNIDNSKTQRHLLRMGMFLSALALMSVPGFASADILNRQLEITMSGSDVSALQAFLAKDPTLYPQALVTGYFGPLTQSAVSNFQARNGISNVGRVGPVTLPVLNFQMANAGNLGIDRTAPFIKTVHVTNSNTSAVIKWTTDSAARGKLFYSQTPIQLSNTFDQTGVSFVEPTISGTLGPYDGVERTAHSVNITGLNANTHYYYLIEALDQSNNVSINSTNSFFRTLQ